MKKRYITLITIGSIFSIFAISVGAIMLNGTYFGSSSDIKEYKNNKWMSHLKDETKLIDVVMPGSHDAGSYNMFYMGKTQGYNIETQLEMGTRYFDLRVNKTNNGYYLFHDMFNGENFEEVLSSFESFITTNNSETLILDFQHFKGDSKEDVLVMIETTLNDKNLLIQNNTSYSNLEYISNLTLKDTRGKCLALFGGGEEYEKNYNFIFSRNNDSCSKENQSLNSFYDGDLHKKSSEEFIKNAIPKYYQNIKEKKNNEGFAGLFVLQSQLTDGLLVFGPYSKEKSHDNNMSSYIKGIKDDDERLNLTNIIMRDFLTYDKCEDIIGLNLYKDLIKFDSKKDFASIFDFE